MKLAMALHSIKCNCVMTDGGELSYEHDGELQVGDAVFVKQTAGEEIEMAPAPDGEYKADNVIFVVEGGIVKEIRDEKPAEEKPTEEMEGGCKKVKHEGEDPADTPAEEAEKPAEETQSVEDRIAALEEGITALREALESKATAEDELKARIEALEAKIASLEEPAGKPAEKEAEPASEIKASSARMAAWAEMNRR